MRAYSMDLRERVLHDADAGIRTAALAAKYSVSPAWVRRLKQRRKATGEVAPRTQRRGRSPGWVDHADRIRDAVAAAPDATLAEYRRRFAIPLSKSALARALIHLGLTRKKSRSGRPSRIVPTSRPDATNGRPGSSTSARRSSSSSTRPGSAPT